MTPKVELALWALAGVAVHAAWASTIATPVDWDPLYYRGVAAHILAGDGAVSGALWALGGDLPLPLPADLHWMPLPSRVLLPGLALWPARGDQLVTVLIAAAWAPAARLLGAELGGAAPGRLAAALTLGAGAFVRFLSTPDSIALYGLLGALGWLALARRRPGALALVAALAALCRGEGFLLGLALGAGLGGARGLAVAGAGLAATGLWTLRNLARVGPEALAMRRRAASAADYLAFARGDPPALDLAGHLSAAARALPDALVVLGLVGLFLLWWPAAASLWRHRRPWALAAAGYALLTPPLVLALAPAVAGSGSVFRTSAAIFVPLCALAADGALQLGERAARARGYPPRFLPGLLLLGFLGGSVAMGLAQARLRPVPPDPCPRLAGVPAGEVVFAPDPLRIDALCGRPAVLLPRGLDPAQARALAARYKVKVALLADPSGDAAGVAALPEEAEALLPGWRRSGEGLLRAD